MMLSVPKFRFVLGPYEYSATLISRSLQCTPPPNAVRLQSTRGTWARQALRAPHAPIQANPPPDNPGTKNNFADAAARDNKLQCRLHARPGKRVVHRVVARVPHTDGRRAWHGVIWIGAEPVRLPSRM